MLNPMTIVSDINLAVQAVQKVQAALPQIQKTVNDIRQAAADKQDTVKFDADLVTLMADIEQDLSLLASLFPPTPVTSPVPTEVPDAPKAA